MSDNQRLDNHPYASFVRDVEKPARYVGGEYQSVEKDPSEVDVSICLAFPDIYDIGMSHLGTKLLYKMVNKEPRFAAERVFAPWIDMEAQLRKRGLPLLSLETARPLTDFDVVGFSLQYEMTFTNVLNMIDLAGMPVRSCDRDESHPLIIAGGPTATHPEPIAPFIDALLIGDAEEKLPEALGNIAVWKQEGLSRRDVLMRLAESGGWYCPALYEMKEDPTSGFQVVDETRSDGPYPVVRAWVEDLNRYPFPDDSPIAAAEAIFDRMSIEIARGCTEGCRFCQAGMIYRPVRERSPDEIVKTVLSAIEKGGYEKISLTSLSTADYSCISPLIKRVMTELRARKASLSVSSLRAYGLEEDLLDEISSVKATGLTFAPEAGTQRMRDVINKNVTDEDLLRTAKRVFERGWSRMKLYFIIGLPTETDEDIEGIIYSAFEARKIGRQYHSKKRLEITASMSSHVPKPHTPFQWAAMEDPENILRKQAILKNMGNRYGIRTKFHNSRVSYLEGIISRGDRPVADAVELAWKKGCRFDGWDDQLNWNAWMEALNESQIDPQKYLGTIPVDAELPWDHIDVGLADGFLETEWKRATKSRLSPPCGKPNGMQVHHTNLKEAEEDERQLICYHCGIACDMTMMRRERFDYLDVLGAVGPDTVSGAETPGYQQIRKNRLGTNLPPLRKDQGESTMIRFRFTKLGTVALTSQQDLTRVLPRAFRRAGLKMKTSQGFNPRPVMSFGPALPLGVPSISEIIDVSVLGDESPEALVTRLAEVSESGLTFLEATVLPPKAKKASAAGRVAEYIIALNDDSPLERYEDARTLALGNEPILMTVTRKKGEREIDIRDGLFSLDVDTASEMESEALGLTKTQRLLRLRIDLGIGAHVRAEEFGRAVFGLGEDTSTLYVARTNLYRLIQGELENVLDLVEQPLLETFVGTTNDDNASQTSA
jgi:radical SAM family uncharacterized protein/radical SAM-linked protein